MANSPFPGMDPFLQPHWLDVHAALAIYIRDHLNERLPAAFRASVEEQVDIGSDDEPRRAHPDVEVTRSRTESDDAGGVALLDPETAVVPVTVRMLDEPLHRRVVIHDDRRHLITAIELISPANKLQHRNDYIAKQDAYRIADVNLVEIDLIRGGPPVSLFARHYTLPPGVEYSISVWRHWQRLDVRVYPFGLWDPIPPIDVPLTEPLDATPLHLQPLVQRLYATGRYASAIDYDADLTPPLTGDDRRRMREPRTSA